MVVSKAMSLRRLKGDLFQDAHVFLSWLGLVHQGSLDQQVVQNEVFTERVKKLINSLENWNSGEMLAQENEDFQTEY